MMQFDSTLFLKQLLIYSSGKVVYNEIFHHGVNIIRGTNSSGKSTISDFIFYALGGELYNWKPEAERCDNIIAQVEINNTSMVFKREITRKQRQPMYIFWGTIDESLKSSGQGWVKYPFSRTENKESFSQLLFKLFNFPEIKSENDDSITMHQMLRVIYIDQKTPFDILMRTENFDSGVIRSAVGDLLLGIYNDSFYELQYNLRKLKKDYELIIEQIKNINLVFANSEKDIDLEKIQSEIVSNTEELDTIEKAISKVKTDSINKLKQNSAIREIEKELEKNKKELYQIKNKLNNINFEIEDSLKFIKVLKDRQEDLSDSIKTRELIGNLALDFCPACLSPLNKEVEKNTCLLCKSEIPEGQNKSQAQRMQQELRLQIKESNELLEKREINRNQLSNELPIIADRVKVLQKEFDHLVDNSRTTRDERIDLLLIKKGTIDKNIEHLKQKLQLAYRFEKLKNKKTLLNDEIKECESNLDEIKRNISTRTSKAYNTIEEYAVSFLKNDLDREEVFQNANKINIDFYRDTFKVNNRNQFSASSMVYLKNSILFSLFFASLELDYFRYPRFILCDNTEDKGMEDARSHKFQEIVVELATKFDPKQYQIIYTTSKINPKFNNTELCVGEEYSTAHKTLDFSRI